MAQSEKDDELKLWRSKMAKMMPLLVFQALLAIATTASIFYGGYYYCDCSWFQVPDSDDFSVKAVYTLRWMFPPLCVLILAIKMVGTKRASTPAVNPLAGKEEYVILEKNFLTNTVEQFLVYLVSTAVLVTFLNGEEMKLVPLYTVAFLIGRILFRIGYGLSPMFRTWGMWTNFLSSAFIVVLTVYFMYTRGCMFGLIANTVGATGGGADEKVEL